MTSKVTIESSGDEFVEHVHHLTDAPLHVPLHPQIKDSGKFNKSLSRDLGIGTTTTTLEREPEPEGMKNYLIYEKDQQFMRYFGAVLGMDVEYHWRPGFMLGVNLALISLLISQLTYTQYVHIQTKSYSRIFETLACYGITVSMLIKVRMFLLHYKAGRALINALVTVYKLNDTGRRGARIRDRLLQNSRFYKGTAIGVMATMTIYLAYPVKAFWVDRELISLMPIEYMFLDLTTYSGFFTANAISLVTGFVGSIGTVYAILLVVSGFLNYSVFVDIFEEDMKCLDEMWSSGSNTTVTYRHSFLKNICRKQQDMDAYVVELKRILDDYIFYYFVASYLGQIICLFQIVVSNWKSGYAIAYGMFLEMMFYCLMGTKIASDNERITSALQQSNWYSYDMYSQKLFLTLWMATMDAKEMWIGILAPLSVLTGSNLVKSIYTYFNILVELS